jgi:hypothetical protein
MDAKTWTTLSAPLLAALVAGAVAWGLVPKAQERWETVLKHRELDLEAVREFHRLYGEFISVWRMWNTPFRRPENFEMSTNHVEDCLRRATEIEGGIESLLVKVAAERQVSDDDIDVLAATRQAFQGLRITIRDLSELEWQSADEQHYVALRTLAAYTYCLLANSPHKPAPTSKKAATNLRRITSNEYREKWVGTGMGPSCVTHR